MKRAVSIFFLLAAVMRCSAELPVTTNAAFVRFASSYDTSTLHLYGDYLDSALYLYFPTLNIHCAGASRSGGSTEEANTNRLEREGLALWANGSQHWGIIPLDDNGGYSSNQIIANLTNTFLAPTWFFNGTAYTNEGGWCSTNTIKWIVIGAIPANVSSGDLTEQARNNAGTNAGTQFAYMGVDMWYPLWWGGWSNDFASGAGLIGWFPQSHPGAPGMLTMAITIATNWLDTNINTCILDWTNAAVRLTNHCAIINPALSGTSFAFTWKADRHSMAFDAPDGTITNNAQNGFKVIPGYSNAFYEVIRITNAPIGNYSFAMNGTNVLSCTSAQLAAGINLFAVTNGPLWLKKKEVLGRIRDKNHCDRVTLVDGSAGDADGLVSYNSFSTSYWTSGFRGDALISQLSARIANLNGLDDQIHAAALPVAYSMTFTLQGPRFAPFGR